MIAFRQRSLRQVGKMQDISRCNCSTNRHFSAICLTFSFSSIHHLCLGGWRKKTDCFKRFVDIQKKCLRLGQNIHAQTKVVKKTCADVLMFVPSPSATNFLSPLSPSPRSTPACLKGNGKDCCVIFFGQEGQPNPPPPLKVRRYPYPYE